MILRSPPTASWPWVNCPQLTLQHFASLCAVEQPADLCSPNLSVINDWPSFWQLFGLKLNTSDKFYKDANLAKGFFRQLKHFIPQLPPGAFQGSCGSHCHLNFKSEEADVRPSEGILQSQERQSHRFTLKHLHRKGRVHVRGSPPCV